MQRTSSYNIGLLFHKIANEFQNKTAIQELTGSQYSYQQLDTLSSAIANHLLSCGAEKNQVVCIFHEKTIHAYASMLACLKLGLIYCNLDYTCPIDRLNRIIKTCTPRFFLAGPNTLPITNTITFSLNTKIINYSSIGIGTEPIRHPLKQMHQVTGADPAYIMFTSGSTGFPKGALIAHASIINFAKWANEKIGITSSDALTNLNPMHFDNSVFDFYASLLNNATLIPIADSLLKQPKKLIKALSNIYCSTWFSVPSLLIYILSLRALEDGDLPSLKRIIFGGEGFPKNKLRELSSKLCKHVDLINVYGPTECTCICSAYYANNEDLESPGLLPLGFIADNFSYLILNNDNSVCKPFEKGELCLLGPNVGLGYYNNTTMTSASFKQNPLNHNYPEIMYCTGDFVYYDNAKNALFFSGRKDNQIKRMGYRIELEEIDIAIGSLPYVSECITIYQAGDQSRGQIISFISAENNDEISLLNDLRNLLPSYMIPDALRYLVHLPKNKNGKIDRQSLVNLIEKAS